MPLQQQLAESWSHIQGRLFPMLQEAAGPLQECHSRLVVVLEMARIEAFVQMVHGLPGRPPEDRFALARAYTAKAVLNLPTTRMLIDCRATIKVRHVVNQGETAPGWTADGRA